MLIASGAERKYRLMTSNEPDIVRVVAVLGPLEVPLDLTPVEARQMAANLIGAADNVKAPAAEEPVPVSADAEALLQDSIARTSVPRVESGVDTSWMHTALNP